MNKYKPAPKYYFLFAVFISVIIISAMNIACSPIDLLQRNSPPADRASIQDDQLSILTYNIDAISEKDSGHVARLIEDINNNQYDFVLLQELFSESTRDEIVDRADTNHFKTIVSRLDYMSFPELLFQDSGLFLMSRHKRIDLSHIEFEGDIINSEGFIFTILSKEFSRTYDFLANKSVLGGLFKISDDTKLLMFTTHVQALGSNENKELQLAQIYDFMNEAVKGIFSNAVLGEDEELVVVLAGDFNVDAYNSVWRNNRVTYPKLLDLIGNPRDLLQEFNGHKREYTWNFKSTRYPRRFDYIFAYDSLAGYNLKKLSVKDLNVIDIRDDKNSSLSDHRGISTELMFEHDNNTEANVD